jgi:hypothetical protein
LLGRVGEVGVNLEAVEIADDQERRIFEVFAVELRRDRDAFLGRAFLHSENTVPGHPFPCR